VKAKTIGLLGALAASLSLFGASAGAAGLSGAGGTAIYPVLSKWAAEYDQVGFGRIEILTKPGGGAWHGSVS